MPSFRRGKPMWKDVIGDNIIVIDSFFFSILASSYGMTMADFLGPYGEHALKPSSYTPTCFLLMMHSLFFGVALMFSYTFYF